MYSELREKIVSMLESDAAVTSLLASETSIYYHRPPADVALPCITYAIEDAPARQMSGYGGFELTLHVDLYSTSMATNDQLLKAVDAVLFDAHRGGAMDTTSWSVKQCRRLASEVRPAGEVRSASGLEAEQRSTRWILRVYRKNA